MDTITLSAKVTKSIENLRSAFTSYIKAFGALTVSREELAPKFVKAFTAYKEEVNGGLADFCRLFDPEVPDDRNGYKAHRTYQAADYLVRLSARLERETLTPSERAKRLASKPVTGNKALARTIAAFLPLVDPDAVAKLWEAVASHLNYSETMVENLKAAVEEEDPLFGFRAPKGTHVTGSLRIVERAA